MAVLEFLLNWIYTVQAAFSDCIRISAETDFLCRMVRDGYFGYQEYFRSLCDSIDGGGDFYLLGSDFESYLEAQVILDFSLQTL